MCATRNQSDRGPAQNGDYFRSKHAAAMRSSGQDLNLGIHQWSEQWGPWRQAKRDAAGFFHHDAASRQVSCGRVDVSERPFKWRRFIDRITASRRVTE